MENPTFETLNSGAFGMENGNGPLESGQLLEASVTEGDEVIAPPVEAPDAVDIGMDQDQDLDSSELETIVNSSTSTQSLDDEEESPRKGSTCSSDSESDGSDKTPSKRRKKNGGNFTALRQHQELKRTQVPFLQRQDCEKLRHHLGKCLECKNASKFGKRGKNSSICRFLAFRKLRYLPTGKLSVAGFPDASSPPECEYTENDLNLWRPHTIPEGMSYDLAKFILVEVGDQFCYLVKQEKETLIQSNKQDNKIITWRRVVQNLRELCDVCSTTLFNYHWTCEKCGFVVCDTCFKSKKVARNNKRQQQQTEETEQAEQTQVPSSTIVRFPEKDEYGWMKCHARTEHILEELMLTQIVAEKALDDLWSIMHKLKRSLGMRVDCCDPPSDNTGSGTAEGYQNGVAINKDEKNRQSDDDDEDGDQEGLLDFFTSNDNPTNAQDETKQNTSESVEVPASVSNENEDQINSPELKEPEIELKNFVRKRKTSHYKIKVVPKVVGSYVTSSKRYKDVPHSWLCQGYLLQLKEPQNPNNLLMFQEQWKRGQPVIVSNVGSKLDRDLWTPESFSRDFGEHKSNLINCMTGKVVPNRKLKEFWDGFEHVNKRLVAETGERMLLKLKDWPPGDDFAKMLPKRFKDLMEALPLGEYTHRNGLLNLAARLPDIFCKPDLGPKMYIAYGSGLHLDKGTTNLHLDVSDAVNVMVYVGAVKDGDTTEHDKAVEKAIEDSDCDKLTVKRYKENKELPGALWHIWEAKDADKIRDMLNTIELEKGYKVEPHNDAIHDQSYYLDSTMRKRLREEYNVVGYPILQYEGDAVFIPAGAPHQVRNLNNCIKIAEDFVSPETVGHCFYLTEEFRNLSAEHQNHEDKLQIKNIVYHAVKDAVAVIQQHPTSEDKENC